MIYEAGIKMLTEKENLYDRNYNLWLQQAIAALKKRDSDHLDWDNLILEIEEDTMLRDL